MGLNKEQFRSLIVRKALQDSNLWSQSAENLILGIMIIESNLEYLRQYPEGPAFGLCQMEKPTYEDCCAYLLKHRSYAASLRACGLTVIPDIDALTYNLKWCVIAVRMFFARMPEPLPNEKDYVGMANLYKIKYNTPLGKATLDKSILIFKDVCQ